MATIYENKNKTRSPDRLIRFYSLNLSKFMELTQKFWNYSRDRENDWRRNFTNFKDFNSAWIGFCHAYLLTVNFEYYSRGFVDLKGFHPNKIKVLLSTPVPTVLLGMLRDLVRPMYFDGNILVPHVNSFKYLCYPHPVQHPSLGIVDTTLERWGIRAYSLTRLVMKKAFVGYDFTVVGGIESLAPRPFSAHVVTTDKTFDYSKYKKKSDYSHYLTLSTQFFTAKDVSLNDFSDLTRAKRFELSASLEMEKKVAAVRLNYEKENKDLEDLTVSDDYKAMSNDQKDEAKLELHKRYDELKKQIDKSKLYKPTESEILGALKFLDISWKDYNSMKKNQKYDVMRRIRAFAQRNFFKDVAWHNAMKAVFDHNEDLATILSSQTFISEEKDFKDLMELLDDVRGKKKSVKFVDYNESKKEKYFFHNFDDSEKYNSVALLQPYVIRVDVNSDWNLSFDLQELGLLNGVWKPYTTSRLFKDYDFKFNVDTTWYRSDRFECALFARHDPTSPSTIKWFNFNPLSSVVSHRQKKVNEAEKKKKKKKNNNKGKTKNENNNNKKDGSPSQDKE